MSFSGCTARSGLDQLLQGTHPGSWRRLGGDGTCPAVDPHLPQPCPLWPRKGQAVEAPGEPVSWFPVFFRTWMH